MEEGECGTKNRNARGLHIRSICRRTSSLGERQSKHKGIKLVRRYTEKTLVEYADNSSAERMTFAETTEIFPDKVDVRSLPINLLQAHPGGETCRV